MSVGVCQLREGVYWNADDCRRVEGELVNAISESDLRGSILCALAFDAARTDPYWSIQHIAEQRDRAESELTNALAREKDLRDTLESLLPWVLRISSDQEEVSVVLNNMRYARSLLEKYNDSKKEI